jgi:hypothetical protein
VKRREEQTQKVEALIAKLGEELSENQKDLEILASIIVKRAGAALTPGNSHTLKILSAASMNRREVKVSKKVKNHSPQTNILRFNKVIKVKASTPAR